MRIHLCKSVKFNLLLALSFLALNSTLYSAEKSISPIEAHNQFDIPDVFSVKVSTGSFRKLKDSPDEIVLDLPLEDNKTVSLELKRFIVVAPGAKFVTGSASGNFPAPEPDVILFRGNIEGDINSHAYLSFTSLEHVSGYVSTNGETYYIGRLPGQDYSTVTKNVGGFELPPFVEFCGVDGSQLPTMTFDKLAAGPADDPAGARMARIAFDADQKYFNIFGDLTEAQNYLVQLLGAVSDLYLRDVNMRLVVSFMRIWDAGGEPFNQNSLGNFADYWLDNEDTTGYDIIHLVTGRRDLGFGGIAYLNGYCGENRFSISGFINGSFPVDYDVPRNSNWDIIVMAHELGHNFGTGHTHDGQYDPIIDSCAQGFPSRGTIMSYCHIHPGYTSNTDMRFHSRVQMVIEGTVVGDDVCLERDCNGNGEDDLIDILSATSSDENLNNIPDECEDCNGNLIFDELDLALGTSSDIDGNGIPDECQPDCDGNDIPDDFEAFFETNDLNGNNILDECEPDCNGNGFADFIDVANGTVDDFDRNNVPDSCQDCNANAVTDWLDLEREFNVYVADRDGGIREYHHVSGYPIQTLDPITPYFGVEIGPDRLIYATTSDPVRINKIDPGTGVVVSFSSTVSGGNGDLTYDWSASTDFYLSIKSEDLVRRINGTTGADMGVFVSAGSGGLDAPSALTFGPDGNLYVASETNDAVYEYNGATGAFVSIFVTSGSGGLDTPRGLVFKNDGNLLVTSYGTSKVYEYDGISGDFVGQYSDENDPEQPWGIKISPTGNAFVVRTQDQFYQVFELDIESGRYYRSYVRRDFGLSSPAGLAIMPRSDFDCDGNYILDACEGPIASCCCVGIRGDANGDGATNPNLLDLNFLVNYVFRGSGDPGPCLEESNVNGDASPNPNLLDLNFLVNYVFRGGPLPGACAK